MDERTQGALLLAVGGIALRLGLTGGALTFIRPTYVPLLVAAGAVLAVLGGVVLVRALRAEADTAEPRDHDDDAHAHAHDHGRGPRVAWLLAAPLFAILLIAPPPLGSYAASRQSGVVQAATSAFGPLPAVEDGAVPLELGAFAVRALHDPDASLGGVRVRLTGFASDASQDGSWTLTRFALSCCAADGRAINVRVVDDGPAPPLDRWVQVEGTWRPLEDHEPGEPTTDPPELEAAAVTPIAPPEQPYELGGRSG